MSLCLRAIIISLCFSLFNAVTYADPWFTGPILAPSGHNVARGHTNLEVYGLNVLTNAQYDNDSKIHKIPLFRSFVINPLLTHGFTDWLDIQLSIPYAFNQTQDINYHRLADTALGAGFQLFEQKKSTWLPDVRLFIQETFPTGKFENLNPLFLGTDATGLGSYRTLMSLNLQYLKELPNSHYLRTRLIVSRLYSTDAHVHGLNSFGGTMNTDGKINTGAEDYVDLSLEYTLTQNWVAVMEGYFSEGQATRFNGIIDIINDGLPPGNLFGSYYEIGLAPAIEYNFNANVGLIGGVWFPVKGKNTSRFTAYVLALNAYW